jgi:hypothetical protein
MLVGHAVCLASLIRGGWICPSIGMNGRLFRLSRKLLRRRYLRASTLNRVAKDRPIASPNPCSETQRIVERLLASQNVTRHHISHTHTTVDTVGTVDTKSSRDKLQELAKDSF